MAGGVSLSELESKGDSSGESSGMANLKLLLFLFLIVMFCNSTFIHDNLLSKLGSGMFDGRSLTTSGLVVQSMLIVILYAAVVYYAQKNYI